MVRTFVKSHCLIVEPGHRAFKFNSFSGVGNKIFREGWHVKIPAFERAIIYDVRTHPKVIRSTTGTKGKSTTFESLTCFLNNFFRLANCQHQSESFVPTRLHKTE